MRMPSGTESCQRQSAAPAARRPLVTAPSVLKTAPPQPTPLLLLLEAKVASKPKPDGAPGRWRRKSRLPLAKTLSGIRWPHSSASSGADAEPPSRTSRPMAAPSKNHKKNSVKTKYELWLFGFRVSQFQKRGKMSWSSFKN